MSGMFPEYPSDRLPEMGTHFKQRAQTALDEWNGQSDLQFLELLAERLGSSFWHEALSAINEAKKSRGDK